MKKFGFRHLMYGWLAVVALVLTSCDSENVTPINDKTLPEAIAKDFHERCEDYTIKRVYTRPEPYFDSGAIETFVTSEDNAGMSAWSYTLTMRGTAPCGCSLTLTSYPARCDTGCSR